MIQNLSIDLETRSSVDIVKSSVYRYAESDDFDILLFGVSVNHGPIRVYDLARGDTVPADILKALTDNTVEKWAYNSSFERVCLSVWLRRKHSEYFSSYGDGQFLDPSAWKCSMVLGIYNGLPLGLEKVGDNLYAASLNSGQPMVQDITRDGGYMNSGVLEGSNVELAKEFTDMITTQRGFQANSKVITTSDEMLQLLKQLKR